MGKIFTLFIMVIAILPLNAQTVLLNDNFESGTSNWQLTGSWGLSTNYSFSISNSLTESPAGNYPDQTTSTATLASAVDLSTALSAELKFYAIYDLESNFDYTYVEASGNGGTSWTTLASFTGDNQLSPWGNYTYSLGAFLGSSNVKVRFRFVSDQAVNEDGMYIDNVTITSYTTDNSPPAIQHTPPVLFESSVSSQIMTASLIDASGINSTTLKYKVDGGTVNSITGVNTSGNTWVYTLPAQSAGAWVDYMIVATDNSTALNTDSTQWYNYVAGNYIKYETGQVDFVNSFGPTAQSNLDAVAVKITIPGTSDLVTVLIRNYTDPNRPNDSMQVHVWANNNGVPGTDLIPPITVFPDASLSQPNAMKRIDLRPYSAQLSGLSGDVFIGYSVPANEVWTQQTNPGSAGRSYVFNGSTWTSVTDDYHFRAITGPQQGAPVADFTFISTSDPQIVFNDQSTNNPTTWLWDFDDNGNTSSLQDPTYTFSQNRNYTVCLTATNSVSSNSICKVVSVAGVLPVAAFTWDATNDPTIDFTETAPDSASAWQWSFGDGQQSSLQHPSHTYTANGAYEVCLSITDTNGLVSQPYCDSVHVFTVGIDENSASQSIKVFPVPVMDQFYIESPSAIDRIEISDLTGKVVYAGNGEGKMLLPVSASMNPGVYLIKVNLRNGEVVWKRVVSQ